MRTLARAHGRFASARRRAGRTHLAGMQFAPASFMPTTTSKRTASGKSQRKPAGKRRYGAKASEKVERAMHEMKRGELRSGGSGKKVTSRKQAIAIGLSEARAAGGKVPAPRASARRKKAGRRKAA